MKEVWYKQTEQKMFEYYTLDFAILSLSRKNDAENLKKKKQQKDLMDNILSKLSAEDIDILNRSYDKAINNLKGPALFKTFGMSSASFYRRKHDILYRIAMYLGLK